jgi:L-alanine-DL-glutamate epimerase-like enolase superfamily enzyme
MFANLLQMADALLIEAKEEVWPLKQVFRISRGSRTETRVVVVSVTHGDHVGRGECVPIRRYNQTCASVIKEIQSIQGERDLDRQRLQQFLPAGAARNALDCALWDLEAKRAGKRVWDLAAVEITPRVQTAFTISLDTPQNMMRAAGHARRLPLLKLKLGGDDVDIARVKAVRSGASDSRLISTQMNRGHPSTTKKSQTSSNNSASD